ncbi:MAG TPA: hypothetical protein VM890_05180 [Longimicrobium sp.]|jgi:hypothetical protein|nr:hypothetical protein [Longimicrobium sp.]
MRRFVVAALLLFAPLSWAAAQGTPEQRIAAARQRASTAGIPVSLLDGKVDEGRAKGVPMDRIAAVVERRLVSLQRARDAMGAGARPPALTPADLNVGADALDAGVEPAALGRLAREAGADRRTVAIAVLTQLVQEGMASEQALARVTAALARNPDELRRLPGEAKGEGRGEGQARRGPPEVRGPANAAAHGGHANGGGPPASVPGASGKGHGRGRKP